MLSNSFKFLQLITEIIYFGVTRVLFEWGMVERKLEEQVTYCNLFTNWIKSHNYWLRTLSAFNAEI